MSIAAVGLLRAGGRRSPRSVQSRHLHGQNPPSSLSAISNPSTLWWPATAIPRRHRDRLGAPRWFADAVQCWGTSKWLLMESDIGLDGFTCLGEFQCLDVPVWRLLRPAPIMLPSSLSDLAAPSDQRERAIEKTPAAGPSGPRPR